MASARESLWNTREPNIKFDVACLIFAISLHLPLIWTKYNSHKIGTNQLLEPLIQVELFDPEPSKPIPAQIRDHDPNRITKEAQIIQKLRELPRRELPALQVINKWPSTNHQLPEIEKTIILQPKLDVASAIPPRIVTKVGLKISQTPSIPVIQNRLPVPSQPSVEIHPRKITKENLHLEEVPRESNQKNSFFKITGPLKDRAIQKQVLPDYPLWAQTQGIEATVVLEFTVSPDGSVKNYIIIRKTSGHVRLDEIARQALRQWKFVALMPGDTREEVGLITFKYSLH